MERDDGIGIDVRGQRADIGEMRPVSAPQALWTETGLTKLRSHPASRKASASSSRGNEADGETWIMISAAGANASKLRH